MYRSVSPAGHGEIRVTDIASFSVIHLLQFIFLNVCVIVSSSD